MNSQTMSFNVLWGWVMALPVLLVWVGGIVIAIAKWNQHPKVATLVMSACGLSIFARIMLPIVMQISARAIPTPGTVMVINFASNFVGAVCGVLLLCAAFIDREDRGLKDGQ